MRIDQWLWCVRVYPTRSRATEAVRGGLVKTNGEAVKPSREVKPGELITAQAGGIVRTVRVIADPPARVGAPRVPEFAEDLTAPGQRPPREPNLLPPGFRPRGAGRPTKRDRRQIDELQ